MNVKPEREVSHFWVVSWSKEKERRKEPSCSLSSGVYIKCHLNTGLYNNNNNKVGL